MLRSVADRGGGEGQWFDEVSHRNLPARGGDRTIPVQPYPPQDDLFEYQPLRIDPSVSRGAAAVMLSLRAEFAGWELARVLRFPDGTRRVWMRRRRTPGALLPDLTP